MDSSSSMDSDTPQWIVTAKWIVSGKTFFKSVPFADIEEARKALQMMRTFRCIFGVREWIARSISFSLGSQPSR